MFFPRLQIHLKVAFLPMSPLKEMVLLEYSYFAAQLKVEEAHWQVACLLFNLLCWYRGLKFTFKSDYKKMMDFSTNSRQATRRQEATREASSNRVPTQNNGESMGIQKDPHDRLRPLFRVCKYVFMYESTNVTK